MTVLYSFRPQNPKALVTSSSSSSSSSLLRKIENTKYDVPLLAVSYSYSRRAVA